MLMEDSKLAALAKYRPSPKRITPKQQAILELLCKGLRNAEIGAVLGMSERNVKNYVGQLLLIFDATNRFVCHVESNGLGCIIEL